MVSSLLLEKAMGEFPSGQRGQTVNLLALPSVVRIHFRPFTYLLRATVLARMRLISAIGMYEKRICRSGGTGRRPGLKIPWVVIPVPVRFRSAAFDFNLCFWGTEVFCCIFSRNKSAAGTQIRSFSAFSFYIRLFRNLSGRSCDTQIFRISVIRRRKKGMGISLYFLCRGYQTARADISLHLAHNHLFVSPLLFQSNGSTVSC